MKFKYDKLAQPYREIRIAVLQPGFFTDPVAVHFVSRKLEDVAPGYEALSYVWGTASQASYVVSVSAKSRSGIISITRNLDTALRHLRDKKEPRSLWIDALCINQDDLKEKDVQVMRMGDIFATADSVLAWLGPKENNSDLAMALLQDTGLKLDVDWVSLTMRPREYETTTELANQQNRKALNTIEAIKTRLSTSSDEEARSIYFIFVRPFFERAWVVQEIRLARCILFQCGSRTLSEEHFWTAILAVLNTQRFNEGAVSYQKWFEARGRIHLLATTRNRNRRESIYTLRHTLGTLLCKDPRDKIYSALGIMRSSSQSLQITPSYTQPTEQVYTDVVQRVITHDSSLNIFEDCELSSRVLDIPSWVPDWSTPIKSPFLNAAWSACAYVACQPSFDATGLHCTVSGIYAGRVIEVGEHPDLRPMAVGQERFAHIRSLCPAAEDLNSTYLTDERLMDVYCRVLFTNRFSSTSGDASTDFGESLKMLEAIWSEGMSETESEVIEELNRSDSDFQETFTIMHNRRLFKTSSGHLGIAPLGTKVGDALCVLLGCRYPVILRPVADQTYQVVGTCYAHGLMNGEAIYRNTHKANQQRESSGHDPYYGTFSPDIEDLSIDPAEMLEQLGVEIESVRYNSPYGVFVGPRILRDVGIPLEDFVLV